jgi:FdrA protein
MSEARHSAVRHEIRRGAYYDSVVLMQLQRSLAAQPGVLDCGVVMATPANREILAAAGLGELDTLSAGDARADDLLIVIKAASAEAAQAALGQVDFLLSARQGQQHDEEFRPRTLEAAAAMLPEARWVLISVPGRFAGGVAREALARGKNVFLYSDNVPLDEEVELKTLARAQGLLVLGPDCGSAIVAGVGLGFANRVRRGGIGIVAASGTGLQLVTSRIHDLGGGVSHAIGTGGRDLRAPVGGVTALQAIDLLARDPETRVLVLLSKPPEPAVASRVLGAARSCCKPVVVNYLGETPPTKRLGNLGFATSLEDAAAQAVTLASHATTLAAHATTPAAPPPAPRFAAGQRYLRGLFAGGTLATEAQFALRLWLGPIWSNGPIDAQRRLPDPSRSREHTVIDLGADEFTVGRPHPMIDQDLRLRRLAMEAADPEVAVLWLDVVLGDGAHPDPALELAPAIVEARTRAATAGRSLEVLVTIVGTDEDPQDRNRQRLALEQAGARVFGGLHDAIDCCESLLGPMTSVASSPAGVPGVPVPLSAIAPPLQTINLGLAAFHQALLDQGATSLHVDWRPPAGGNERMAGLLAKLRKAP